ncbi:MAG: thioredoxin family protein [Bacteroidota bacterium]
MKKSILFLTLVFCGIQFSQAQIKWMSWEDAIKANKKEPKKIFVDLYTSWCGWCKVMDQKTFTDEKVIKYMNDNFYAVKFNAESQTPIVYNNYTFKYKTEYKAHELAISLLDGNMSYPSFVVLNEKEQRMSIIKGYQEKDVFFETIKKLAETK